MYRRSVLNIGSRREQHRSEHTVTSPANAIRLRLGRDGELDGQFIKTRLTRCLEIATFEGKNKRRTLLMREAESVATIVRLGHRTCPVRVNGTVLLIDDIVTLLERVMIGEPQANPPVGIPARFEDNGIGGGDRGNQIGRRLVPLNPVQTTRSERIDGVEGFHCRVSSDVRFKFVVLLWRYPHIRDDLWTGWNDSFDFQIYPVDQTEPCQG